MNLKRRWRRLIAALLLILAVMGVHFWLLQPPESDAALQAPARPQDKRPATVLLPGPTESRPPVVDATAAQPAAQAAAAASGLAPPAAAASLPALAQRSATRPSRAPHADSGSSNHPRDHPRNLEASPIDRDPEPPQPGTSAAAATALLTGPNRPPPGRLAAVPDCASVPQRQLPPSVNVRYSLDRGGIHGEGQLEWRHLSDRYRLKLEGRLPVMGTILLQRSEGGFDACGLAPRRHSERRLGRSERALSFERQGDAGSDGALIEADRLRFSARSQPRTLRPGTQDRLSWLVEIAGQLNAWPAPGPAAGERIGLDVAAVGGDVQHWIFVVQGRGDEGQLHLTRVPDEPWDTRADIWTDPRRGHWPVRVELREPRGDPLVLRLTGWQPVGP